jgi:hypothetical protein
MGHFVMGRFMLGHFVCESQKDGIYPYFFSFEVFFALFVKVFLHDNLQN